MCGAHDSRKFFPASGSGIFTEFPFAPGATIISKEKKSRITKRAFGSTDEPPNTADDVVVVEADYGTVVDMSPNAFINSLCGHALKKGVSRGLRTD
jgi:hypothetical protein